MRTYSPFLKCNKMVISIDDELLRGRQIGARTERAPVRPPVCPLACFMRLEIKWLLIGKSGQWQWRQAHRAHLCRGLHCWRPNLCKYCPPLAPFTNGQRLTQTRLPVICSHNELTDRREKSAFLGLRVLCLHKDYILSPSP